MVEVVNNSEWQNAMKEIMTIEPTETTEPYNINNVNVPVNINLSDFTHDILSQVRSFDDSTGNQHTNTINEIKEIVSNISQRNNNASVSEISKINDKIDELLRKSSGNISSSQDEDLKKSNEDLRRKLADCQTKNKTCEGKIKTIEQEIKEKEKEIEQLKPVSYTHLTLPTKRIV